MGACSSREAPEQEARPAVDPVPPGITTPQSAIGTVSMIHNAQYNLSNTPANFYAGKTRLAYQKWRALTSDKSILTSITGVRIDFTEIIQQHRPPPPIPFSNIDTQKIDREIDRLLNKGIIEPTEPSDDQYISNIFFREKKNGEIRLILNLKYLNLAAEYHHFRMETIQSVVQMMTKNCFMASVDLKDAYYSIPVHTDDRKYLRFKWGSSLYQFTCLPNGLSEAPRKFTKILKVPFAHLRSMGHANSAYIDDSALLAQTVEDCQNNIRETITLMDDLGFTVHPEKSSFIPQQIITYLGFTLNSIDMTVRPTFEKIEKIQEQCRNILAKNCITIRDFATLIGSVVATEPGVDMAPVFYRRLEQEKTEKLRLSKGHYDSYMKLSITARTDIEWWLNNIHTQVKQIQKPQPEVTITTDSSNFAWGGTRDQQSAGGPWGNEELDWHINLKELTAIWFTLTSLCRDCKNTHIRVLTDNTTALAYINKKGGRIQSLNDMARQIWLWAHKQNIWLSAVHLPGKLNVEADSLSRTHYGTETEWKLAPEVFKCIDNIVGPLTVDLFASRLNNQCSKYISWHPDPKAIAIDAFHHPWKGTNLYAFPPFSVIGAVLQKVAREEGTLFTVLPLWPTQPWFNQALAMSFAPPRLLPKSPRLLTLPQQPAAVHPIWTKLHLTLFWFISHCLQGQGFPHRTAEIILQSWRETTKSQYRSYLRCWLHFCYLRKADPLSTSVNLLLSFLTQLFEQGLGYSAINTAKSAVSVFIAACTQQPEPSTHWLISKFLKGVFTARPALPRNAITSNPKLVLNHLASLFPSGSLSFLQLSRKLLMLLALLTGQRGQSLHLLDLRNITCIQSCLSLRFGDLLKTSRPGHHLSEIRLPAYSHNPAICVVKTFQDFLIRSKPLRGKTTRLFIASILPHGPISRDTVSQWIKSTMSQAGIDLSIFTPHSTRSAATSAALRYHVPLSSILATAGWSNADTFRQFYNRPVRDDTTFASRILDNS